MYSRSVSLISDDRYLRVFVSQSTRLQKEKCMRNVSSLRSLEQRLIGHSLTVLMTLILAAPSSLFGQAAPGTSTIRGLVTDSSGAVIPGVEVVVRNVDTNVRRELTSNETGLYEAVSLQPGNYEVKVTKPGFTSVTRTGIS